VCTHKVEDASGGGLVLSALGEEKETLASLAGPGSDGVGDGGLLVLVENGELLALNSLLAEVEVALGETETPKRTNSLACDVSAIAITGATYLTRPGAL
jgi:hypothetical protein